MAKALLINDSVNTLKRMQQQKYKCLLLVVGQKAAHQWIRWLGITWLVFYAVSAVTVAMKLFCKHIPTTEAEFSVCWARRLHNTTLVIFGSEFQMKPVSEWVPSQFQRRSLPDKVSQFSRWELSDSDNDCENLIHVIRRPDVRVIFGVL
jgi:hypothetical protein